MSQALAAELTEALDVTKRDRRLDEHLVLGVDRFDAGQVQHRIQHNV